MKAMLDQIKSDFSVVYNPIDKLEIVINNNSPVTILVSNLYSFISEIFIGGSVDFIKDYSMRILLELAKRKDYLANIGLNPYIFEDYNLDDNSEDIVTGVNSIYVSLEPHPSTNVKIEWVLYNHERYH